MRVSAKEKSEQCEREIGSIEDAHLLVQRVDSCRKYRRLERREIREDTVDETRCLDSEKDLTPALSSNNLP